MSGPGKSGGGLLAKILITALLELSAFTAISRAQSIVVGPNVWVSAAMPGAGQYEVTLASDPADSRLLLAGSMVWSAERVEFRTAAYVSRDGGASWRQTLLVDHGLDTQDPAVAYGPNHSAYFVSWGNDASWNLRTLLSASQNGGNTWRTPSEISTLDREFISVDNTTGEYRGRIYVNGQDNDRLYDADSSMSSIWILRFDSLRRPLEPKHFVAMGNREITIPTNGIVTGDGSYITGFVEHDNPVGSAADTLLTRPNATLKIIKSVDGGSRFGRAVPVARMYDKFGELNVSSIPWLAVDGSPTSRLRGRLYAVWADRRSGRSEIWLARSPDGGDHWSEPVRVNDDTTRATGSGPDDFHPMVAVNSAGVVGVMWYDRRDNPDDTGWWVRFAASMDGGETFSPSVRVSEAPLDIARDTLPVISAITRGGGHPHPLLSGGPLRSDIVYSHFNFVGGHTAGLAATGDGLFHPLWVDDRTGVSQIYTATVRVLDSAARPRPRSVATKVPRVGNDATLGSVRELDSAKAPRHGAVGELKNISQLVTLELSQPRYIARDSLVTVNAVLRNTSTDTLRGPFELHVLSLKSDFGEITDSGTEPSAVIVLASSNVPPLPPGGMLARRKLTFHLAHPPRHVVPTQSDTRLAGYGVTLVSLQSDVFGRLAAAHAAHR